MTSASTLLRSLLVYGLSLPLAIFLGYLLATPLDFATFATVGIVLFALMLPVFLRWHHPWLIASWNMSAVLFFVPGHPQIWMGMTLVSLGISLLQFTLNRQRRFLSAPSVTWSLVLLAGVTILTAFLTGGVGSRVMGSETFGGRRYLLIGGGILGFFAIIARQTPPERVTLYVLLFFLGHATMAIGNLAGIISPAFNFLFLIFPVENLSDLVSNDVMTRGGFIVRSGGLTTLSLGGVCALLAYYSLRRILDLRNPVRLVLLAALVVIGMYGGFRSILIEYLLTLGFLFLLEGLHRTRYLPIVMAAVITLGAGLASGLATYLPLSVQRSLAFLPVDIDPTVKLDVQYSTEWRVRMWQDVLPDVPRYLLLGKGYGFKAGEADIARLSSARTQGSETAELAGDYHNGPLSTIVPLGLFGALAVLWFFGASIRVCYLNYKYGNPDFKRANTFIFALFLAKVVFFMAVFGCLYSDLYTFTGLVGLSISVNGGVAKPAVAPEPESVVSTARLSPLVRRMAGMRT